MNKYLFNLSYSHQNALYLTHLRMARTWNTINTAKTKISTLSIVIRFSPTAAVFMKS